MLSYDGVVYASWVLALISVVYFFSQSDEIPMLMTALYASNGLYRYYVVAINPSNRRVGWVVVAYSRNIFDLNNELALRALNYFLLGTAVWVISYILWRWIIGPPAEKLDVKDMLGQFMLKKRTTIVTLFAIIIVAVFYSGLFLQARSIEDGFYNTATGVSYLLFLPFAVGGIIILMYLIFSSINYQEDPTSKMLFLGLLLFAGWLSYNPGARFNFLSWVIALGVIIVRNRPIGFKLRLYTIGGTGLLIVYSLAGLARTPGAFLLSAGAQVDMAIDRLAMAEDQNLLDGFMMALQVYPDNLDFQHGFQHLEILMRPIPRAIWPGKPLGGYANKLGLNDYGENSGLTIGISESIYGTFYGEGGVPAMVLLSFLYGGMLAFVMRRSERFESDMRWLIKGLVISSIVALIRGGDLAGIVAFIGMAFWPVFIFMRQYATFVRQFNSWFASVMQARKLRPLTTQAAPQNTEAPPMHSLESTSL